MATMTATILKSATDPKPNSILDVYHHKPLNQAHPNYSFPYLTYKKELAPESQIFDSPSHKSSSLNSAEAFILKSNLILRSSSLYDNSNYPNRTNSALPQVHKFAHPDFTDSSAMIAKPSVMTNLLPRVEIAKVVRQVDRVEGPSNGISNKSQQENMENRTRRALERLSPDELQQLARLIYKHFANNRNKSGSPVPEPVPADYNEEDPHTWPSNWLSQAPTMILEPDKYLAQKPMLNSYQRQLIRRISQKYEPLVAHYLQQLLALRVTGQSATAMLSTGNDEVRKLNRLTGSRVAGEVEQVGGSSSMRLGGKPRQQLPAMVKSASMSSALSSQARINSINSGNNNSAGADHNADLGYCHKEAGTLLSSIVKTPELSSNGANYIASRGVKTISSSLDDSHSHSNGRPSTNDLRQSSLDSTASPQLVSSSRSPKMGADRENRLTRLSQQMANKWSSKMKTYLRKN